MFIVLFYGDQDKLKEIWQFCCFPLLLFTSKETAQRVETNEMEKGRYSDHDNAVNNSCEICLTRTDREQRDH